MTHFLKRLEPYYSFVLILSLLFFQVALVASITKQSYIFGHTPSDWTSAIFYLWFLGIAMLVVYNMAVKPADPKFLMSLFFLAFIVRLIASLVRYWMLDELYNWQGDATNYWWLCQLVANDFSEFGFSILDKAYLQGTEAFVYSIGILFYLFSASLPANFFLFTGISFIGSILFYRAYLLAYPDYDPTFFRIVIFFLPSILFWTSSLGKDALIFFCLGSLAYGFVKYLRKGSWSGLVMAGIGLLIAGTIRPHIASFTTIAGGIAYFLFQRKRSPQQILVVTAITGISFYAIQANSNFLINTGLPDMSVEGVQYFYESLQRRTLAGGSSFTPIDIQAPYGIPLAIVTVFFRPFVWEAHNAQSYGIAVEAMMTMLMFWFQRHLLWTRIKSMTSDPWIGFVLIYLLLMIIAFSSIANFGILARQRTMILPFLWMLLV